LEGLSEGEKLRKKKIRASNEHAYSLEEVAEMLDKLPEPARTVCAVAAFTGLTQSELRGLKRPGYDGTTISVQRKIWNDIGAARRGGYFRYPAQENPKQIQKEFPNSGEGWIFRSYCARWIWIICRGGRSRSTSTGPGLAGMPFGVD
jgi:hypothetical protein